MKPAREPPLHEQVGFDYAQAVREIHRLLTYDEIAERIGYDSKGSISRILDGAVPKHVQGEAIWALYIELFGRKPPLNVQKREPRPLLQPIASTSS